MVRQDKRPFTRRENSGGRPLGILWGRIHRADRRRTQERERGELMGVRGGGGGGGASRVVHCDLT
jgi:hypothetical protein